MSGVLNFFNQGWVGLVVGVLLSVVLYVRAKRTPRLSFDVESIQVIRLADEPDIRQNVSVMYRGKPVPKLTAVTVTLWNSGTATLDGSSLVAKDLLRVTGGDSARILEASVDLDVKPACGSGVAVSEDRSAVHLHFDFLDPGDGYKVRLLHTGTPQTTGVKGVLKGVAVVDEGKPIRLLDRILRLLPFKVAGSIFFLVSGTLAYAWYKGERLPWFADGEGGQWAMLIVAVLAFFLFLVIDTLGDGKMDRVPSKFRRRVRRAEGKAAGTAKAEAESVALRGDSEPD